MRAAGGIRGDLEGVGCTVCSGVVHLHDLAAQHLAAHKAVIQHAVEGVVEFRHHILVAVSGDDGTEGAAGGVQDLLEEVRKDDGPRAVLLQVHHIHAAVLGCQHPQEVLGIPLLGQGALQLFVQALELTLLPVAAVVSQLVLLHGLLGLVFTASSSLRRLLVFWMPTEISQSFSRRNTRIRSEAVHAS